MSKFKLSIKGLFGWADIDLDMDRPIRFLTGLNGSGKSTVLKILHHVLCRNAMSMECDPFLSVEYEDQSTKATITKQNLNDPVTLPDYHPAFQDVLILGESNVITLGRTVFETYPMLADFSGRLTIDTCLSNYRYRLTYENDQDVALFQKLWETNHSSLLLPDAKTDTPFCFVSRKTGKRVSSDDLSHGETRWFLLLYALVFLMHEDEILILDSPENDLHIAWWHELMNIMRDVMKTRPFHCLIATHSPFIISEDWEGAVDLTAQEQNKEDQVPKEDASCQLSEGTST